MDEYRKNIGKKVCKKQINPKSKLYTPRPFKSTLRYNTVKDVIIHPILNVPAYTFVEDDSYVECRRCQIIEENILVNQ